jgi:orotate phosphoribosyltransferase
MVNQNAAQASGHDALAQEFVAFAVECGVLRFGEFKTKAGRMSPYFFNAGLFDDGARLARLAEFYARRLLDSGIEFDMVFGPAYKGIPLGAALVVELARRGRNVPFAYNRKEAKDHGEGGARAHAVCIALDRQEMATEKRADGSVHDVPYSAVQYVQNTLGLQVCAIAKLADLMQYLAAGGAATTAADHQRVLAYRQRYGVEQGA